MVDSRRDAEMVRLEQRMDHLEARVDLLAVQMNRRFDAMEEALVESRRYTEFAYEQLLDQMNAGFADIHARLDASDARSDRLETRVGQLEGRFDQLEGRFDQLEGRFDQLEGRFDQLEGRFDQLEGRFDQLEGRFDQLETKVTRIAISLDDIGGHVRGVDQKMDRVIELVTRTPPA